LTEKLFTLNQNQYVNADVGSNEDVDDFSNFADQLKTAQLFIFQEEYVTLVLVNVLLQTLSLAFQLVSSNFQYDIKLSVNAIFCI